MIKILYALIAFTIFSGLMILQSNSAPINKPVFAWCHTAKYKTDCCREVSVFMLTNAQSLAEGAEIITKRGLSPRRVRLYNACLADG